MLKFIVRILIAGVFLYSGYSKLSIPLENFEEVLRGYSIFPEYSIFFLSRFVPVAEFSMGLLLAAGLLTRLTLLGALAFFGTFITVLSRALILKLPIADCGCFGKGLELPAHATLGIDICLFGLVLYLLLSSSSRYRLDSVVFKKRT